MTNLCPFCQFPVEEKREGFGVRRYRVHICQNEDCRKKSPQNLNRWIINLTIDTRQIIFYRVCILDGYIPYVLVSESSGTRLYYDQPGMGALAQPPIIEIPKMLPIKKPYLNHIQQNFNKLLTLLPYL